MAKKVTHITRSDGTEETIVEQRKGAGHAIWVFLAVLFVLVEATKHWWLGVVIVGLFILGVVGKAAERKASK